MVHKISSVLSLTSSNSRCVRWWASVVDGPESFCTMSSFVFCCRLNLEYGFLWIDDVQPEFNDFRLVPCDIGLSVSKVIAVWLNCPCALHQISDAWWVNMISPFASLSRLMVYRLFDRSYCGSKIVKLGRCGIVWRLPRCLRPLASVMLYSQECLGIHACCVGSTSVGIWWTSILYIIIIGLWNA